MSEWISIKKKLPPFGKFVEVIFKRHDPHSHLRRGFAALIQDPQEGIFWSAAGWDERSSGKFGITHWIDIRKDPRGKIPIIVQTRTKLLRIKFVKDE